MITPGALSTYRFCSAIVDEDTGQLWLTDPVPYTYRVLDDTIEHQVTEGDTYESIAAMYYQSIPDGAQLWRIVAEFQPTIPLDATVPPIGPVVYVPSIRTVLEEIFSESRRPEYEA